MSFGDDESNSDTDMIGLPTNVNCDTLSQRDQRIVVFHLLYALDAFDYQISFEAMVDNFVRGFSCAIDPAGAIYQKASMIVQERDALDAEIKPLLHNWRFERIGTCTRLVLRISLWEFLHTDLAPSVVINEAVELAKSFAEVDAHKFVNGLLDEWAKIHGKIQNSSEEVAKTE